MIPIITDHGDNTSPDSHMMKMTETVAIKKLFRHRIIGQVGASPPSRTAGPQCCDTYTYRMLSVSTRSLRREHSVKMQLHKPHSIPQYIHTLRLSETTQERQECLQNQQRRLAAETVQEREKHPRELSDNHQCRLTAKTGLSTMPVAQVCNQDCTGGSSA